RRLNVLLNVADRELHVSAQAEAELDGTAGLNTDADLHSQAVDGDPFLSKGRGPGGGLTVGGHEGASHGYADARCVDREVGGHEHLRALIVILVAEYG